MDDVIKEKIKVELVKFQVYVFVVIAMAPGVYALFINFDAHIINKKLFEWGVVIIIGLLSAIVYTFIKMNKLLKQLEELNNDQI